MRVCIQCLGCYNEGKLNFKWYNRDELRENLDDLNPCKKPLHEEYMMADFEGLKNFGEYPDYEKVLEIMDLTDEYGEPFEIWLAYAEIDHLEKHEIEEKFMDEYVGEYTEKEYAEEWLAGVYRLDDLPYEITSNIDYEGVWIDLKHNGYFSQNTGSPNYTNYIFRS